MGELGFGTTPPPGMIPDGYRLEETDEAVMSMGRRFLRSRAEALVKKHPPLLSSYHLRIEKIGFCRYEVVAYQNRLVEKELGPCSECGADYDPKTGGCVHRGPMGSGPGDPGPPGPDPDNEDQYEAVERRRRG